MVLHHLIGLGLVMLAGGTEGSLPGTEPLVTDADLAVKMVAGIDRYLDQRMSELSRGPGKPTRQRLARIIGAVDPCPADSPQLEFIASSPDSLATAHGQDYSAYAVRWPALDGVFGEGLLLEPKGTPAAAVVAVPDADVLPEQLVGLLPGVEPAAQYARRLAENGCRVLIPTLINRGDQWSGHPEVRYTNQPHREFLYRGAYQMGRHIIGYEVRKIQVGLEAMRRMNRDGERLPPLGLAGYGEGGLLVLHAAALGAEIQALLVSGYIQPREQVWSEPIYRNVWSLLPDFRDAELLSLVRSPMIIVEASAHPPVQGPPPAREDRRGAAPGAITTPTPDQVRLEAQRATRMVEGRDRRLVLTGAQHPHEPPGSGQTLSAFLKALRINHVKDSGSLPVAVRPAAELEQLAHARLKRQFDELNGYTQRLYYRSASVRRKRWSQVEPGSVSKWLESSAAYREQFWNEIIGKLPTPEMPMNPRTRRVYDEPKWQGYEVVLDVYPEVIASGILLLPKDLKPGERRPVVICQHGLEGRSRDSVATDGDGFRYYQRYAARLAERGFVVYSPQNPYIGGNAFRQLQRKANPQGLSLFSFIIRQHERTLDWLAAQPFVDSRRIGFYGLSYGGKTAMRVPAILSGRYAAVICSGDFNEWIWKTTANDATYSYLFTGEYEMFEFNLGETFNYAELAGLICPTPFMVERGHDDGVAPDEQVAFEYAKVRRLYNKLGIGDRTEIEFFDGPHQIHGVGTFAFLHKHLNWPEP